MASETLGRFSKSSSRNMITIKGKIFVLFYATAMIAMLGMAAFAGLKSLNVFEGESFLTMVSADRNAGWNDRSDFRNMMTMEVVVRPGDTLWAIAQTFGPGDRDVREIVDWIRQINDLKSGTLSIGQVLLVPVKAPN